MVTVQIGTRLVKPLTNNRTVVTENLGKGKILTKVLNEDGSPLFERLKVVSEPQKVGNKTVIHTDRILQKGEIISKSSVDRVYDGEEYLGSREIIRNMTGPVECKKRIEYLPSDSDSASLRITKYNDEGLRMSEFDSVDYTTESIGVNRSRVERRGGTWRRAFNNRGLMIPNALGDWEGMTILQMRKTLQESRPDLKYTNWPGMESLDARVEEKATNLFDYLG